jgi:hypothetical protein
LEKAKTERSQQSRGNRKKICNTLQKAIRMQMEAWTLLDGGSQLHKEEHAFIDEARIRRELIL